MDGLSTGYRNPAPLLKAPISELFSATLRECSSRAIYFFGPRCYFCYILLKGKPLQKCSSLLQLLRRVVTFSTQSCSTLLRENLCNAFFSQSPKECPSKLLLFFADKNLHPRLFLKKRFLWGQEESRRVVTSARIMKDSPQLSRQRASYRAS